ncbi:MAG: hypothetical protein NC433_11010 [Clostridiales bacterium]|nr:hypothetical protein [Clostridiales bacterium]
MSSKPRVDWHEAASCAFQIELKDYSEFLEYTTEYILGNNSYRIDMLVVKNPTNKIINKNIAQIFKTLNLIEIKGVGSSVNIDSYYKTIGYAGLLIAQMGQTKHKEHETQPKHRKQYSSLDVSITFLCFRYPRKLIKHLRDERKLTVAKVQNGVYYISKETFNAQIIVTKELSPEDNLYLHCLTDNLHDAALASRLADDYILHKEQDIYNNYLYQLTTANKKKGESSMKAQAPLPYEWIFNLCGTSSTEIIEHTKKEDAEYYLPKIEQLSFQNNDLTIKNNDLTIKNNDLTSQNAYLKSLLEKNNIPFDFA